MALIVQRGTTCLVDQHNTQNWSRSAQSDKEEEQAAVLKHLPDIFYPCSKLKEIIRNLSDGNELCGRRDRGIDPLCHSPVFFMVQIYCCLCCYVFKSDPGGLISLVRGYQIQLFQGFYCN